MASPHLVTLSSNFPAYEIFEDIDGYIQGPVDGFFQKYFPTTGTGDVARQLDDALSSKPPTPETFSQWFQCFAKLRVPGAQGEWHQHPSASSEGEFQNPMVFLATYTDAKIEWSHVKVIGRCFQDASQPYKEGLLSLCESARSVFMHQPTRLFLHGFHLHGSLMELWVFDRSGMYCSKTFDYRDEFLQFLRILIGYQLMTGEQIGENPLLKRLDDGSFSTADNTILGQGLLLEKDPIAYPEDIVGNGTTCYRAKTPNAKTWDYVVKFKWRVASRDRPEEDMLQLIKTKNVWGVISLEYSKEICSTSHLRQGLDCPSRYRKFRGEEENDDSAQASEQATPNSLLGATTEAKNRFEDRIGTCIILSPPGRKLGSFKDKFELLEVFRDAVKAHRSLLQDANVLHQDISPGNIIITDSQNDGQPKSILIDFDVAMDLAVGPRTPGEVTGTRPFMAIGILLGRRHWYRHDLESFLYVFIWVIITNGSESPPRGSKLRQWSRGDWDEIAAQKTSDMDESGFPSVLAEFPTSFESLKSVAETIRGILFPIVDGSLWTGTDNGSETINRLYDGIIRAFENAIESEVNNG